MKTKFMKKMIALICAAVMTTSCATASVGALGVQPGASEEIINKVKELSDKVGDYKNSLNNVDLFKNSEHYSGDSTKTNKRIKSVLEYIKKEFDYFVNYFDEIEKKAMVDSEKRVIDRVDDVIGKMKSDIDNLVNVANNISIDKENDKLFYLGMASTMNIDEDKDCKKELTPKQARDLFGDTVYKLKEKLKYLSCFTYAFIEPDSEGEESAFERLQKAYRKLTPKLSDQLDVELYEFEETFREGVNKGEIGIFSKEAADAIRKVTGAANDAELNATISIDKKLEYFSSDESVKEATSLIKDAILKMIDCIYEIHV